MVRLGLIGCGYWGQKLLRNAAQTKGCVVTHICDRTLATLSRAAGTCRTAVPTLRPEDLLNDPQIDGVIIAAPAAQHFSLAMAALCRGKHLLVEKPMTTTSEHARQLIDEAARRNRVLLVDHTFVFSPQVDAMRRIVAANDLGRIHYVDAVRGALGSFSAEINVFWDVAVHDLSILLHVFDDQPIAVTTIAGSGLAGCRESFGYMSLRFASGMIAHIHASWLWPVKTRRMTVASDRGFIVYDDTAPDAKIVRYPADFSTVAADAWNEQFRSGMLLQATPVPDAGRQEPLSRLLQHFRDCIVGTAQPCPNGMDALKIIRTLEAADRSLQNNGVQEWL